MLDAAGGARTEITDIPGGASQSRSTAELEYRDPNGEAQTVSNSITIWPAKLLAGIRAGQWVSSVRARVHVAVVDEQGKPAAGAPVRLVLFSNKTFSYRKRLVGGFYAYENTDRDAQSRPIVQRQDRPARRAFVCKAKPALTGSVLVQASVTDDAGNTSYANTEIYIPSGEQREWFEGHDDDRMDVLPEKPRYEPGETARVAGADAI